MNKELLDILIKKLEKDIDKYCGDYGSLEHRLEHRLEDTLYQILNILKVMNGEIPFGDWYIEELKEEVE